MLAFFIHPFCLLKYEEEFYEYLRERTNLDVNIELHEANVNGPPKSKRKKSEVSEHDGSIRKFHFHYQNGSNRIVSF